MGSKCGATTSSTGSSSTPSQVHIKYWQLSPPIRSHNVQQAATWWEEGTRGNILQFPIQSSWSHNCDWQLMNVASSLTDWKSTSYTPLPRDKGWECGGGNIAIMGHLVRTSSNHYAHLHCKLLTNERSVFSLYHMIIICCCSIATILLYQLSIENLPSPKISLKDKW